MYKQEGSLFVSGPCCSHFAVLSLGERHTVYREQLPLWCDHPDDLQEAGPALVTGKEISESPSDIVVKLT